MRINHVKVAMLVVIMLNGGRNVVCQGTFQNLGFENPLPPLGVGFVPIGNALPHWTGYLGPAQVNQVVYDTIALSGAAISLQDAASPFYLQLAGSYAVLLQGSSSGPATSAAIAQAGQLPADAASMRFWASPGSYNMQVTLGGQNSPLVILGSAPSYNILGGDVSAFAGLNRELRFTALANGNLYFDNIQFSNLPIPEPSAFGLFGLGSLVVGWRWRRRP